MDDEQKIKFVRRSIAGLFVLAVGIPAVMGLTDTISEFRNPHSVMMHAANHFDTEQASLNVYNSGKAVEVSGSDLIIHPYETSHEYNKFVVHVSTHPDYIDDSVMITEDGIEFTGDEISGLIYNESTLVVDFYDRSGIAQVRLYSNGEELPYSDISDQIGDTSGRRKVIAVSNEDLQYTNNISAQLTDTDGNVYDFPIELSRKY